MKPIKILIVEREPKNGQEQVGRYAISDIRKDVKIEGNRVLIYSAAGELYTESTEGIVEMGTITVDCPVSYYIYP